MLLDAMPSSIDIGDGIVIDVNTDFRAFIMFEDIMFGNNSLSKKDKILRVYELFSDFVPSTKDEANAYIDGILHLYRCGKPKKELNSKIAQKVYSMPRTPKYFDFTYDAPYIYASFVEAYGIDLTEIHLHWYKFKALFDSLPESCHFSKIISYRGADVSQIKDKNEKQRIIKLQHIYALPRNLTEQEKVAEAGRLFSGG